MIPSLRVHWIFALISSVSIAHGLIGDIPVLAAPVKGKSTAAFPYALESIVSLAAAVHRKS